MTYLAALLATTAVVPVVVALWLDPSPRRSPLLLFGVALSLGTVLHVYYWVFSVGREPTELLAGSTLEAWTEAIAVIAVWTAIASLSYATKTRSESRNTASRSSGRYDDRSQLRPHYAVGAAFVVTVSLVGLALLLRSSGIEDLREVLLRPVAKRRSVVETGEGGTAVGGLGTLRSFSGVAGPAAALLFAYTRSNEGRTSWTLKATIFLLLMTTAFVSLVQGGRTELAVTSLIFALLYVWTSVRLKVGRLALAVGLVGVLVVAAGIQRAQGNGTLSSRAGEAVVSEFVAGRSWINPSVLAPIYVAVPDRVDLQLGSTYAKVLIAPIPRELWPSKPGVRVGPEFGGPIYGFNDRLTGSPPGIVGETYLNFGLLGIPLTAVIFGRVLRSLRKRIENVRDLGILQLTSLAYVTVAVAVRLPGGDFVGVVVTTLRSLVVLGVVNFIFFKTVSRMPLPLSSRPAQAARDMKSAVS